MPVFIDYFFTVAFIAILIKHNYFPLQVYISEIFYATREIKRSIFYQKEITIIAICISTLEKKCDEKIKKEQNEAKN